MHTRHSIISFFRINSLGTYLPTIHPNCRLFG
jgi:hypothetical protein